MRQKRRENQAFSRFSLAWTRLFATSLFARFVSFYSLANEALEKRFRSREQKRRALGKSRGLRLKTAVSNQFTDSLFVRLWKQAIHYLLSIRLKSLGVFFLVFGLFNCTIFLVRRFWPALLQIRGEPVTNLICGVMLFLSALPLISKRRSLSTTLMQSLIWGTFLSRIVLLRDAEYPNAHAHSADAFCTLSGLILGLVCIFVDPFWLFGILFFVLLAALSFYKPEFGAALMLFAYPFLSVSRLCIITLFVTLCLLLKVLRGKRTLRFDLISLVGVGFGIFLFFSAAFSSFPGREHGYTICLCTLSAFLCGNLSRRKEVLLVLCGSFSTSVALSSLFHLLSRGLPDSAVFASLKTLCSTVSQNASCALIAAALPLVLSFLLRSDKARGRLWALLALCVMLLDLWVYSSLSAWVASAVAVVLLIAVSSRMLFFICALLLLAALVILPILEGQQTAFLWEALAQKAPSLLVSQSGLPASAFVLGLGAFTPEALASFRLSSDALSGISMYSQLLLSVGLFGFLLFALSILFSFQKAADYYLGAVHNRHRLFTLAPIIGAIALLTMGLTLNLMAQAHIFSLILSLCAISSAAVDTLQDEDSVIFKHF